MDKGMLKMHFLGLGSGDARGCGCDRCTLGVHGRREAPGAPQSVGPVAKCQSVPPGPVNLRGRVGSRRAAHGWACNSCVP
eukprot:6204502-Pleurochrysis_carterae.AAC.1